MLGSQKVAFTRVFLVRRQKVCKSGHEFCVGSGALKVDRKRLILGRVLGSGSKDPVLFLTC